MFEYLYCADSERLTIERCMWYALSVSWERGGVLTLFPRLFVSLQWHKRPSQTFMSTLTLGFFNTRQCQPKHPMHSLCVWGFLGVVYEATRNCYELILSIVSTQRAAGFAPCISILPARHWFVLNQPGLQFILSPNSIPSHQAGMFEGWLSSAQLSPASSA